jgi:hypothetical protein
LFSALFGLEGGAVGIEGARRGFFIALLHSLLAIAAKRPAIEKNLNQKASFMINITKLNTIKDRIPLIFRLDPYLNYCMPPLHAKCQLHGRFLIFRSNTLLNADKYLEIIQA